MCWPQSWCRRIAAPPHHHQNPSSYSYFPRCCLPYCTAPQADLLASEVVDVDVPNNVVRVKSPAFQKKLPVVVSFPTACRFVPLVWENDIFRMTAQTPS